MHRRPVPPTFGAVARFVLVAAAAVAAASLWAQARPEQGMAPCAPAAPADGAPAGAALAPLAA